MMTRLCGQADQSRRLIYPVDTSFTIFLNFQRQAQWGHDSHSSQGADYRGEALHLHQEQDLRGVLRGGARGRGLGGVPGTRGQPRGRGQLLLPGLLHGPPGGAQQDQQLHLQPPRQPQGGLRQSGEEQRHGQAGRESRVNM